MKATLVIGNIGELATPTGSSARRGAGMSELRVVRDAAVAIDVETIVWAGPAREMPPVEGPAPEFVDAGGRAVVPGIVDSHTHFVFGGYRAEEFYWRAAGLPYMEIHARGGGIANTVRDTRSASLDDLLASATPRLERMLELGITTVEGKSGYGLDLDTEIRQLEAMRVLDARQPVDIVATYMGPHSIPTEYKDSPSGYIDFILRDVLPRVRERGLARFCDVFCDHLLKASGDDLDAMARAGVVATCLPVTAFTLREPYADARGMIDRGLAVALASDLNPGSCYSQSIPLVAALGVLYMNMSIEEVLTALTLNGAAAVGQAGDRGSIEPGKIADALILDAPSFRHLAYNAGMNIVDTVIKRGKVVSVRN